MNKIKISQAIIVEGKYDKIKLSSFIDGVILCTNGFQIYRNKETVNLIRQYAKKSGVIILTDSDSAGFQIRGHLKGIIPNGKIYNLYIPEILGKEKRKTAPSKEGKLGVEGISIEILRDVFKKAGILDNASLNTDDPVTKMDFFELGISGCDNSAELRQAICKELNLPLQMSAKALLESVNTLYSKKQFFVLAEKVKGRI